MLPYKDHSGQRLLFADAIRAMAIDRYGLDWKSHFSELTMRTLPERIEDASDEEQIYAAYILQEHDSNIVINQIKEDFDENIPSSLRSRFALDIDPFHWSMAIILAESSLKEQSLALHQLLDVLVEFAVSASKGITKCYSREIRTFSDQEIEPNAWQVDLDTLKMRFISGIIENRTDNEELAKHMIIVDRSTLPNIKSVIELTYDQKLLIVQEKLREAMKVSVKACPHGKISTLRDDISKYLSCDILKATSIIDEVTDGCWSIGGQKGSTKNPTRVTP